MDDSATRDSAGPGAALRIWAPAVVIALVAATVIGYSIYRHRDATTTPTAPHDLASAARADLERHKFRPLSGPLEALLADPKYEPVPTQTAGLLLKPAPAFTLADVDGKAWTLAAHLKEGPLVLVFYYGYHCDHCVSQLFALNKDLPKFRELGAQVVAVSADAAELTRERYRQYGPFDFPVLTDPGNQVATKYEAYLPNPTPGKEGDLLHATYVIGRDGTIVWVNRGDTPFFEDQTLLYELARSEGRLPGK